MHISEYHNMAKLEEVHFWYRAMNRLTLNILKKFISNKQVKILDAGCGTGGMTKRLEAFGEVTGIDISTIALNYAYKKGINNLQKASICNLPFSDKTFNVVVSLDVLYHKKVKDDIKALRELYRVLKTKGLILIRVPAFELLRGDHDIIVETKHRYTAEEVKEKMEKVGFKIEKLTYANMVLSIPLFIKRGIERRRKFEHPASDTTLLPKFINEIFYYWLNFENKLLNYAFLPFGSSVICLGRKIGEGEKKSTRRKR